MKQTMPVKAVPKQETVYSSPKIAAAFQRRYGERMRPIKVEMKYTSEIKTFIRKVGAAHKATLHSELVFK